MEKIFKIIPENINSGIMGNYKEEDVFRLGNTYMHGDIERVNDFDIFYLLKSDFNEYQFIIDEKDYYHPTDKFNKGIYDCECMGIKCKFYFWKIEWDKTCPSRGLVVDCNDLESNIYANKCYLENKSTL